MNFPALLGGCALILLWTGPSADAQTAPAAKPAAAPRAKGRPAKAAAAPAAETNAPAAAPSNELSVDDVVAMTQAGLAEDIVLTKIRQHGKAFNLSTQDLIKLKQGGVSNAVLKTMLDPTAKPEPAPAPAAVATPAPVAQPAAAPAPAPDSPAAAGFAGISEIGVYTKKNGQWVEVLPEVVNWKTGGVLKTIASAGIVKGDVNGNVENPTSRNTVKTPLEFVIYTPEGVAITEYQLLKLRQNKGYREFRTITGGVLHAKSGATRDLLPFEHKKVGVRLYQVVFPPNIGAGEFGFLPPGAIGSANSASIGKLYSFRVVE